MSALPGRQVFLWSESSEHRDLAANLFRFRPTPRAREGAAAVGRLRGGRVLPRSETFCGVRRFLRKLFCCCQMCIPCGPCGFSPHRDRIEVTERSIGLRGYGHLFDHLFG